MKNIYFLYIGTSYGNNEGGNTKINGNNPFKVKIQGSNPV